MPSIPFLARIASAFVVFGIPGFVVGGATWHFTHSFGAVGVAEFAVAIVAMVAVSRFRD